MKSKHIVSTAACAALFLFQTGSWAQSGSGQSGSGSSSTQSGQTGSGSTSRTDTQTGTSGSGTYGQSGTSQSGKQTSSTAETSTGMKATSGDREFAKKAALGGMLEVELGGLATQKGSTEAVRQFGQRMIDDHSKVNDRLKQIASQNGMTLPTSLDTKHRATVQRLSKLSGERFDQAYMKEMHKDHMQDVSEFEKISGNSSSSLKAFADETLPTLREHLASAQSMSTTMGGETTSSSTPGQGDRDTDTSSSRKTKSRTSSQSDTDTSTQPPKQ